MRPTSLEGLPDGPIVNLDPERIGLTLFETTFRLRCPDPDVALERWPVVEPAVGRFLDPLERRALEPGLALRARRALERRLLAEYPRPRPVTVGGSHAATISLVDPIADLDCPGDADRAVVSYVVAGERVGSSSCRSSTASSRARSSPSRRCGRVAAARPVLRENRVPRLEPREEEDGIAVRRGDVVLARGLAADQAAMPALHDHIG